jgi:hypothetical protein
MTPTRNLRRAVGCLMLFVSTVHAAERKKAPELVGTVSFDVQSRSGRVETMEVTIGDGGTGPHKAILSGDPTLPTHAIYRPRDLKPFGNKRNLLPIVAFANGGCRNTSGEFRNFLSDIASQGFLVVSIGPAANSVIMGSEERTNTTASSQLLDGVAWAIGENGRPESDFYQRVDVGKVAVMGQSCGGGQAVDVSLDPRVTTTVVLNQGVNMAPRSGGPGLGRGLNAPPARTPAPDRYAPFAPALVRAPGDGGPRSDAMQRVDILQKLHAPILFLNGGPKDSGFANAKANFEAIQHVPVVLAYQDVGHYPATYRQPNGGAFARAVGGWLKWHLKGDQAAKKMFAGQSCGLCVDGSWKIERKKID